MLFQGLSDYFRFLTEGKKCRSIFLEGEYTHIHPKLKMAKGVTWLTTRHINHSPNVIRVKLLMWRNVRYMSDFWQSENEDLNAKINNNATTIKTLWPKIPHFPGNAKKLFRFLTWKKNWRRAHRNCLECQLKHFLFSLNKNLIMSLI